MGDKPLGGFAPQRLCEENFVGKAGGNGGDERDDEDFDEAKAAALQSQNNQDVEGGDEHAGEQREPEKELQGDRGAEDFREVAGGDGDFANDPQHKRDAAGILLAARLREVAAGGDAELGGKSLQQHGHEVAEHYDTE